MGGPRKRGRRRARGLYRRSHHLSLSPDAFPSNAATAQAESLISAISPHDITLPSDAALALVAAGVTSVAALAALSADDIRYPPLAPLTSARSLPLPSSHSSPLLSLPSSPPPLPSSPLRRAKSGLVLLPAKRLKAAAETAAAEERRKAKEEEEAPIRAALDAASPSSRTRKPAERRGLRNGYLK